MCVFNNLSLQTIVWLHDHIFFLSHLPGRAELIGSLLPSVSGVPLVPKLCPVTTTVASVPVYQDKSENNGGHSKQISKFQPNAQTKPTQPMPLQPSANSYIESMPEALRTFHPEIQTKSQPQEITQPLLHTHFLSSPKPEPHSQSAPQTTPLSQYEPKSQPTPKTNRQFSFPTQLQLKTQSKLQAQFQPAPLPTSMALHQTVQPTLQNTLYNQETLTTLHTHSSIRPQTHTQPQPQIPQTKSNQLTERPETVFSKSKLTTQSTPKNLDKLNSQKKTSKQFKTPMKPRKKSQQNQTIIQTHHQSHFPSEAPFQIPFPLKEQPAPVPHPKPQPRVQSETQTRTQAEHFKDTPMKAVHKGNNPFF